jgi:hypothetical protein
MSSKAHVEYDPAHMGVRLAVLRERGQHREVIQWPILSVKVVGESAGEVNDDDWLRLQDDDARAIYEALADYFGHSGHDTRALRRDYDSERARVDKLISHLIEADR